MMQFIVGKDGKPRDFKVVRAVNPLLDAEATRVLEKMPNWEPGKENGKTVDVSYNLPIRFKLEEDKKKPSGK
jgi:protein TonB